MGKRVSGPPRRPRNPVVKAVRTPLYRQRVVPDKRGRPPERGEIEQRLEEERNGEERANDDGEDGTDV
ncbi:MAG TPA: hypothetical protein PLW81_02030 [Thiobacillaceae bacterium]|nr:hypothetical protein [Thiobacillaceae bacterium]